MENLFRRLSSEQVPIRVHDVIIKGNTKTKESLIEAEMEALKNATTLQELLKAARFANARLQQLDIFNSIKITLDSGPPELPGTINMVVEIVESENQLTGSVGVFSKPEIHRNTNFERVVAIAELLLKVSHLEQLDSTRVIDKYTTIIQPKLLVDMENLWLKFVVLVRCSKKGKIQRNITTKNRISIRCYQIEAYYQAAGGENKRRIYGLGSQEKNYYGPSLHISSRPDASSSSPPSVSQSATTENLDELVMRLIPSLSNHLLPILVERGA